MMTTRLLFCSIAAICFVCGAAVSQNNPVRLKVGASLPLTGAGSLLGEACRDGLEIYEAENPTQAAKLDLRIEDIGTAEVSRGVSAVRKLVEIDKVDALIMQISNVVNASAPLIERLQIPSIAVTGDDSARGKSYIIKLWPPAAAEGRVLAECVVSRGMRKIALLTSEQDSMIKRREALLSALDSRVEIALDVHLSSVDETGSAALRVASLKSDAVVLMLMPGLPGVVAKRLRELKFGGIIMGAVSLSAQSEIDNAQGALKGAYYTDSEMSPEFRNAYREKYKSWPYAGAANCHDALKLLAEAFEKVGNDRVMLNREIRRSGVSGALGTYSFTADQFNAYDLPVVMREVE
jgi:ABC-type branched-subunit amino acid transport system substrate-binding protein